MSRPGLKLGSSAWLALVTTLVGCGGQVHTLEPATARATDNRARTTSVAAPASATMSGDPALEPAIAAWVEQEAGPGWQHVTLASMRCGEQVLAILWPFGRGGRIEDDDVVAVPFRAVGSQWVLAGSSHLVRNHPELADRCGAPGAVTRGRRGLPPEGIGRALIERLALFRAAASRADARAIIGATLLLAEVFDDDAVTSDALPDMLTDLIGNDVEVLRAEARGLVLHVAIRERQEVEEHDLGLVPVPAAVGLVMIQMPR